MDRIESIKQNINDIQALLRTVFKEGVHYGKIPGCGERLVLFKAGAEKIMNLFSFVPKLDIERLDDNGHREYIVKTSLYKCEGTNATLVGEGLGSASTKEKKYRKRRSTTVTKTPVPKSYWSTHNEAELRALMPDVPENCRLMPVKQGKAWYIAIAEDVENPNIADEYNTVLKMAKKRSLVDAVITATSCSDLFVQDVLDIDNYETEAVQQSAARPPKVEDVIKQPKPLKAEKPKEPQKKAKPANAKASEGVQYTYSLRGLSKSKFKDALALLKQGGAEYEPSTKLWKSTIEFPELSGYLVSDEPESEDDGIIISEETKTETEEIDDEYEVIV